jgi:hypothetical protein
VKSSGELAARIMATEAPALLDEQTLEEVRRPDRPDGG